jgi:D-alanyl-D-alanine carboxypeptidase/D-alanyl-D-alanine-endopeptidase (penicillin-binding protein 4)
MLSRKLIAFISILGFLLSTNTNAHALSVPSSFKKLATSPTLAKPGIIVFDPITQAEIYSDLADVPRAPASVQKLISTSTALNVFGAEKVFKTTINATDEPNTFLLLGEFDPWLTTSSKDAQKYHRAVSTKLISAVTKNVVNNSQIKVKFNGLFEADIRNLRKFYGKKIKFERISRPPLIEGQELTQISEVSSPPLSEIIGFTLLWSDNVLADRLARNAAAELGYPRDSYGINLAFQENLEILGVNTKGLNAIDGSGLSHDNRVSARTIVELLWKIRGEPKFQAIYEGLPTAGETGTLRNRYQDFGASAKGLVKAKTGWINTSVTLAGYVEAGESEYVFAVIASNVNPTENSRDRARKIIDKMLATIAKPVVLPSVG